MIEVLQNLSLKIRNVDVSKGIERGVHVSKVLKCLRASRSLGGLKESDGCEECANCSRQ